MATKRAEHDIDALEGAWALPVEACLGRLGVRAEDGLSEPEAAARLRRVGPNALSPRRARSAWSILRSQFESLVVALLGVAALAAFAFGQWVEGSAVLAVLALNGAIGFLTELRGVRSMEALRRLGAVPARVRRGGHVDEVPARSLVPGDIVLLDGGDVVPADVRLIEAWRLQADESALTGESLPVSKRTEEVAEDAPLGERRSVAARGTAITRGSGAGVVVATGPRTEVGRIARLADEAEEEVTPLERRLEGLARSLAWLVLAIGAATTAIGIARGREPLLMLETGIALAVAAIPEGLPIVATIALARGMWRMARRGALTRRLSAVETLGATSVLLTDKTGTLTENRLAVERVALPGGDAPVPRAAPPEPLRSTLAAALEVSVLCNDAALDDDGRPGDGFGDPLEVALLAAGRSVGLDRPALVERLPEVREEAFDPRVRMMATYHRERDGAVRVAVKGAAEAVLAACSREARAAGGEPAAEAEAERPLDDEARARWLARADALAADGLRVLALADKRVTDPSAPPYEALRIIGLVGLADPVRPEAARDIAACRAAGVRVVMATGDQPVTARRVAYAAGLVDGPSPPVVLGRDLPADPGAVDEAERRRLLEVPVFARVDPRQKLQLIALHQGAGAVVGMTGDGVNDAPALKKAEIGIAMGRRGTQVAREAADMVLTDDRLSTIVVAIEEGRVIVDNLRKFVVYLLSCNLSEVLSVTLATLAGAPLPILPLQILFLNLVTDVFPALALGLGEGDPGVLARRPRDPKEPLLTRRHAMAIAAHAAAITAAVLLAQRLASGWLGLEARASTSVSFLTLALAQVWHVFNMRSPGTSILANDVVRSGWVWGATLVCLVLTAAAMRAPGLSSVLELRSPGGPGLALALGLSLVPLVLGQTVLRPLAGRAG